MSLRGNIRKLAVIVAVAGAVAAVPTSAMAWGHAPMQAQSSSQSLESGSAGVGLFGPHASWFNFHEHSDSVGDCGC
ncbi:MULTISPECIES: hypothetical protein [Kitasatospora]|uniref:Uncharacterized protein n=1 Tax=Kitasatospora cathayae TaxID=3004092 RepID=A0ABY7PZA1_9ACTN|nr:hypothetical protein [Kitasatospora sp. HUAS 3-15]WBP85569.1 hypothetical protein O1G21_06690 [Kitasatospora sp. HUAS 3-15]